MPQITVDHSVPFDRRAFALDLHGLVAETVSTSVGNCKTRFREVAETFVADGTTDAAMVNVEIAFASGRTDALKTHLAQGVLALLHRHLKGAEGVRLAVEVRDLEKAYRRV
ncbi:isomerase [Streptomyces sp. R302]|uniref:5-carboxymethyl-2-hydroxymuconate Delta-isomerase n=1 Tax=unclassified Streptomyces TaxID=2593676 RepID=UPI00145E3DF0|nr:MULTISPECIES: isomerase [unclassified Streptomyces]NML49487.1 isomerase [Streptomyces sp. R301]NML77814.1 isomerase [Streptomyces sp. R302]